MSSEGRKNESPSSSYKMMGTPGISDPKGSQASQIVPQGLPRSQPPGIEGLQGRSLGGPPRSSVAPPGLTPANESQVIGSEFTKNGPERRMPKSAPPAPPPVSPPGSQVSVKEPPPPSNESKAYRKRTEPDASQSYSKKKRRVEPKLRPPEHLRRKLEAHLNGRSSAGDKRAFLGALKFLPFAVFKALENMPQPWESAKQVKVLYHVSGAVAVINETPWVAEPVYAAKWGEAWTAMRYEKHDRANFRRMRLPPFDDDEPPVSWHEHIEPLSIPEPIEVNTKVSESRPNREWHLNSSQMHELWRAARPLFPLSASRAEFAFDQPTFETAKALNDSVQNGPVFEPLDGSGQESYDADEFDDARRIIYRQAIRTEAKVSLPHLYGGRVPSQVRLSPYTPTSPACAVHYPKPWVTMERSLNDFESDPKNVANSNKSKNGHGRSGLPVKPFLSDEPLVQPGLQEALELWHAPKPFCRRSGHRRRAQDVALAKPWVLKRPPRGLNNKTRLSYQHLLKSVVRRQMTKKRHSPTSKRRLLQALKATKFFAETQLDWLEAAMMLTRQGWAVLQLLIHKRGLHFLHLDYNFNLKPTKTLTTKERKRSRFGNSFHLVRELLKLLKIIVDAHLQFRMGNTDAFELADGLHYAFNHVGQLTGIYRYKYRVMRQVRATKDLKHIVYERFNANGVGKGPGCGFWQPSWRVWLSWLRGTMPLLERWLGNLVVRQFQGRHKSVVHTTTKQRVDAQYDLELRAAVLHEVLDAVPEGLRQSKTKLILAHLAEAWRCWKAGMEWSVPGMPAPLAAIIQRYVRAKANSWVRGAHLARERISSGATVDKSVARKNVGRLTRLWLREEQHRQREYARRGPWMTPDEAVALFKTTASFLHAREFGDPIGVPPPGYKDDNRLLTLAVDGLKEVFGPTERLNQTQREELALLEQAFDNPHEALTRAKRALLTKRVFRDVQVELQDDGPALHPTFAADPLDKLVDAYLDRYLWLESSRKGLFPSWVGPKDDVPPPVAVRRWCTSVATLDEIWDIDDDARTLHVQFTLDHLLENADLAVLNRLLRLVVDGSIADYITSRLNSVLVYKDMSHVNQIGIIRGLAFGGWLSQFWGLCTADLGLLGLGRATELAGEVTSTIQKSHPIRLYYRFVDKVWMVVRLTASEVEELVSEAPGKPELYPTATCWPRDLRMRLVRGDTASGWALFSELTSRLPSSVASVDWNLSRVSVYSGDNPALTFEMHGFEVRLTPRGRVDEAPSIEASWRLTDPRSGERTAVASLQVAQYRIDEFAHGVRQIVLSTGAAPFSRVARRWNGLLTAFVAYFREAAVATPRLLDVLVKCETRIQNRVKLGLNSKMPSRFPPCVFYSPEELGGLGMISASHIIIPEDDYGVFRAGMDGLIPTVFRYIPSWDAECVDSDRAWAEYALKKATAAEEGRRIMLEDLEDAWDRGLPRISTLFARDRATLALDRGHRTRAWFSRFSARPNPYWWTDARHDGRLWSLQLYRRDVVQALGGVEAILEHSLFKGTGFDSWEGLFWDRGGGPEEHLAFRKLTNAQRTGLSQLPNRRFTLWWSPTINRANVYVGFLVQLDLTGIFLHGKIPTLKISLVQIFRAHLWQKIHESLVVDLCQVLDREADALGAEEVRKLPLHPRKSYRLSFSAADILLGSAFRWPVARPSLVSAREDPPTFTTATEFWIDVQLRWGDFDSHDIARYARARFLDYTQDGVSLYPSPTGLVIAVDLAYNTWSAYGNWVPGLKILLQQAMARIMQVNPALYVLRDRVRKALQLHQAQPTQPHLTSGNYSDMFGQPTLLVDDSASYRVTMHRTVENRFVARPVNSAVLVVDPRTGQLFLRVLHASVWAGQKRRAALSKWKAAEEIGALLRSLPVPPKQLVVGSRGLMDPLEVHMLDFPNIAVRHTELALPFKVLLSVVDGVREVVDNAQESKMALFSLYDDWLETTESSTAFSRLLLILRALLVDASRAKAILGPSPSNRLWPRLSRDRWIAVENDLSDLVVGDYARNHGISPNVLTQSEVRDIVLGQPIKPPSEERQRMLIESSTPTAPAVAAHRHQNIHGDEMTVVTSSAYEQQAFVSRAGWRQRMLACAQLPRRARTVHIEPSPEFREDRTTFVLPQNLLKTLVTAADVRTQVGALIYGQSPKDNSMVKEIRALAILPQLGTTTALSLAPDPQLGSEFDDLELIGVVRTQISPSTQVSAQDLAFCAHRNWPAGRLTLALVLGPGSVTAAAWQPTDAGIAWGTDHQDWGSAGQPPDLESAGFGEPGQLILSDRFRGFTLVPQDEVWNHAFLGALWNPRAEAYLKLGRPLPFFHELHRPVHFLGFTEAVGEQEFGVDIEDSLA